jgi:hypothetical protein
MYWYWIYTTVPVASESLDEGHVKCLSVSTFGVARTRLWLGDGTSHAGEGGMVHDSRGQKRDLRPKMFKFSNIYLDMNYG